ncbi:hypothetical protein GW915_01745 [bacterium]|nr:hypothetical protein [bacterium]
MSEKGVLKPLLGLSIIVLMLGFVTYLPSFLPQNAEDFPGLSLKFSRNPSTLISWLKNPEVKEFKLNNGMEISSKLVDSNGVSFKLTSRVAGEVVQFTVNLVEIEQESRETFNILGYLVDSSGKESFFRSQMNEEPSSAIFSLDIFQSDYSSSELALLYRHAQGMGLR